MPAKKKTVAKRKYKRTKRKAMGNFKFKTSSMHYNLPVALVVIHEYVSAILKEARAHG